MVSRYKVFLGAGELSFVEIFMVEKQEKRKQKVHLQCQIWMKLHCLNKN